MKSSVTIAWMAFVNALVNFICLSDDEKADQELKAFKFNSNDRPTLVEQ